MLERPTPELRFLQQVERELEIGIWKLDVEGPSSIMSTSKNDILQGTLTLLVLKTLAANRRMHGYAITTHVQRVSADLLRLEEGSLYPALHRMEQQGWLKSEWGVTEKNREARFYSLTAQGRKQLALEEESWVRFTEGVGRVLRYV
jgi:transcriptional regulator